MAKPAGSIHSSRLASNISILYINSTRNKACEVLGCRIDYLATHDYKGDVEELMGHMELLYNRFTDHFLPY